MISPEPVTSTEIESSLLSKRIETWAFGVVTPLTVLIVRPRQSKEIDSTVSKEMPEGNVDRARIAAAVAVEVHRYVVSWTWSALMTTVALSAASSA